MRRSLLLLAAVVALVGVAGSAMAPPVCVNVVGFANLLVSFTSNPPDPAHLTEIHDGALDVFFSCPPGFPGG